MQLVGWGHRSMAAGPTTQDGWVADQAVLPVEGRIQELFVIAPSDVS